MKTLKIGIASYDQMKARTMAIARGDLKPGKGEPKVWFTSVESFAKVLSQRNCELLTLISHEQPTSLTKLAALSGRKPSNLSRTLKTMAQYGFVELKKGQRRTLVPRVLYDQVSLDVSLRMGDQRGEKRVVSTRQRAARTAAAGHPIQTRKSRNVVSVSNG